MSSLCCSARWKPNHVKKYYFSAVEKNNDRRVLILVTHNTFRVECLETKRVRLGTSQLKLDGLLWGLLWVKYSRTSLCERPPLISYHFPKIPKVFKSNHYRWLKHTLKKKGRAF